MKKDCQHYREAMTLALVDELDSMERERLEEHLKICSACAQEREELAQTLREMASLEDADPRRSFYLPLEASHLGPIAVFRLLPTTWKRALTAAVLALAVGAVLGWSQLRFSIQDGALVARYGPSSEPGSASVAVQLHDFEKRQEERNLELLSAVEQERAELRSEIEWSLVSLLETGLREHEARMEPRWQLLREQARSDTKTIMEVGLATLHESWRTDMEEISLAMRLTLASDYEQEQRMAVMTRALLEVSDDQQSDG